MSYLVLARKYRPQTFEQVVAQEHVTRTLTNAISSGRVAHAILFSGPRGTGKTTVARILAKAMNCEQGPTSVPCNRCRSCEEITAGHSADVFEIDGASNNGVDQVRELRDNVKYMPSHSPYKIYIIDEVHMLSIAAFNALLKTLEEPPAHILFFFATTEPHKIPITILSRCQKYDFRRMGTEPISGHLRMLCSEEGIRIPDMSLQLIAREAGGSMRDALSLLDQVMACCQGEIDHEQVLDILGAFDSKTLFSISDAVGRGDVPALLTLLEGLYDSGKDLKKLYTDLMGHFRNLLVAKVAGNASELVDLPPDDVEQMRLQVASRPVSYLEQLLDLLAREETSVRLSTRPKLAMEMALIRLARLEPVLSIDTLIDRLDVLRQEFSQRSPVQSNTVPGDTAAPPLHSGTGVVMEEKVAFSKASEAIGPEATGQTATQKDPRRNPAETWQTILSEISKKYPSLVPNFSNSKLLGIDGKCLEIEVSGTPFNLSRIKLQKNMNILKDACGRVTGFDAEIRIVEKVSETEDTAAVKMKENQLRAEAMGHPLVNDAMEVLDAKVVDVKIL